MRVNWIAALLASLGVWLAPGPGALAQDAAMPTPKVVIYPGDIIRDDMLADLPAETAVGFGPFAEIAFGAGRQDGAPDPIARRRDPARRRR